MKIKHFSFVKAAHSRTNNMRTYTDRLQLNRVAMPFETRTAAETQFAHYFDVYCLLFFRLSAYNSLAWPFSIFFNCTANIFFMICPGGGNSVRRYGHIHRNQRVAKSHTHSLTRAQRKRKIILCPIQKINKSN